MTSSNRASVIVLVEFWHNKLFIFTDKASVILDQRFDLFRLRDLDWFDRCENFKFSAVCPPKWKMKVPDSANEMPGDGANSVDHVAFRLVLIKFPEIFLFSYFRRGWSPQTGAISLKENFKGLTVFCKTKRNETKWIELNKQVLKWTYQILQQSDSSVQ